MRSYNSITTTWSTLVTLSQISWNWIVFKFLIWWNTNLGLLRHFKTTEPVSISSTCTLSIRFLVEFEKWCAIRGSVGWRGGVLLWVAWVVCLRGGRVLAWLRSCVLVWVVYVYVWLISIWRFIALYRYIV